MKVSLNWLRDFLDINKTPSEIADILTSLGLEVEGWETVKPSPVDLDKVLIGKVLTCEKIPDTDHLSATTVDVGDPAFPAGRSVVCGAPNVAAGQKVFLAVPGAQVFSKDGSLFTIAERKVRGVASQGMICAQDELGLGHDHSGIMILHEDAPIGISAADYLQKKRGSDTVFDIGLTPNRADAISHLGIAKDLLAWIRVHENPNAELKSLEFFYDGFDDVPEGLPEFPVEVLNYDACPCYGGVVIEGITVGESPEWLKNRLIAVGQRPINNVVDVTNYVRIEMGQPFHAFDLDKVKGEKIIVRTLPEGTPFTTLDGVERKLHADDLMICDGESNPMCIAGVFGGLNSGVTESTKRIFLECAVFNPVWIRRTMIRHGLRTDSAWAFEKGVDPGDNNSDAMLRGSLLIEKLTGGKITTEYVELQPELPKPRAIQMRFDRINTLIGEELPKERILEILTALNMPQSELSDEGFIVWVNTDKPDISREADVVEEILRLHGLDNVPIPTQMRSSMEVQPRPNPVAVQNLAADFLAANGFNECMSLSLTNSAYFLSDAAALPITKERLVFIHNSANQGLDCMRPTMLFSGLEAIQRNQNRQNPDLRLFEMGKTYEAGEAGNAGKETNMLALFMTGAHSHESWQPSPKKAVDFYTLKAHVTNLLARLGIAGYQETTLSGEAPFQYALQLHRGPQTLAVIGAVMPQILKKMDIKNPVFYAECHFDNLLKALGSHKIQFAELSKFPTVRRDLALVVDQSVAFADVRALAAKTAKKMLKEVNLFDVFEDEVKLGPGKKSCAVSFVFEDFEKTLQEGEIDTLMGQLTKVFEEKLGAVIRK